MCVCLLSFLFMVREIGSLPLVFQAGFNDKKKKKKRKERVENNEHVHDF